MKKLLAILAILGCATSAHAINTADLYELECIYQVSTGRPRVDARIQRECPSNEWVIVEREADEFDIVCVETAITETGVVRDLQP